MKNYKLAYENIQKVKELIRDLSFEDAAKKLAGYNYDDELFDFDFGNITGTIWNNHGMALLDNNPNYDVIDSDWENAEEPIEFNLSESEIEKRAGNSITIGRNETVGMTYDEMNYFEPINDGE